MNYNKLTTLLLLILPFCLSAQTIEGRISNKETKEAIPFVNVSLKGTYNGTVSDSNGDYKVNIPSKKTYTICFSCIGYETLEIEQEQLIKQPNIALQASLTNIGEVVVMPDSTLRSFLRKAYKKIPDNYPSEPSSYEIFYREGLKDSNANYLRLTEILGTAYKSSYKNNQDGTIEVHQSRKYNNTKRAKEFNLVYYGGIHLTHSSDDVKARTDFLKPHNSYNYELIGIDKYNGRDVYIIGFTPKPNRIKKNYGRFYIDAQTLAYIKIETHSTNYREKKRYTQRPGYKCLGIKSTINYTIKDSVAYFQSIHHEESVKRNNDSIYTTFADAVVSSVQVNLAQKIKYDQQVPISYIPSVEATNYANSDWKNYATLADVIKLDTLQTSSVFNAPAPKPTFTSIVVSVLQRFEVSLGISYAAYQKQKGLHQLSYNNLQFENQFNNSAGSLLYASSILLKLTKHHGITYNEVSNFSSGKGELVNNYSLCYNYRLPVKTIGKNIFIDTQLGYSWLNYGQYTGKSEIVDDFKFGGKTFNSDDVKAYTGLKQNGYQANISGLFQVTNILYFTVGGGYFSPNKTEETLYLKEANGFFKTTANEPLNNANIEYTINNNASTKSGVINNNWQVYMRIAIVL